jgi:hypothetical protein
LNGVSRIIRNLYNDIYYQILQNYYKRRNLMLHHRSSMFSVVVGVAAILLVAFSMTAVAIQPPEYRPGRVIVQFTQPVQPHGLATGIPEVDTITSHYGISHIGAVTPG